MVRTCQNALILSLQSLGAGWGGGINPFIFQVRGQRLWRLGPATPTASYSWSRLAGWSSGAAAGNSSLVPIPRGPALPSALETHTQRTCPPSPPPHRVAKTGSGGELWGAGPRWGFDGPEKEEYAPAAPAPRQVRAPVLTLEA